MNCQKFETVATELARGQMMEVELRDEAFAHSADCSNCATQLRDEEMLSRELQSLATEMALFEAPSSLETNLLSAFRQQQVVVPMPVRKDYRRYWLVAVAALILVFFSVVAVRLRSPEKPSPPQQAGNQEHNSLPNQTPSQQDSVPVIAKDGTSKSVDEEQSQVQPRKPRRQLATTPTLAVNRSRGSKVNSAANHVTREVATDFMPLGYLSMESVQDGGQIVRVELPRTALVKFGIPVNMDRPNERVKADLLLGMDGMAHAIRFVQDRRVQ